MTQSLQDAEFGTIQIRRSALTHSVRLKIDHRGKLIISMPKRAPLYLARHLVNDARDQIRTNLTKTQAGLTPLRHGDLIGKSHRLVIRVGSGLHGRVIGTFIEVTIPSNKNIESAEIQSYIKEVSIKALRTQAKAYLTRELHTKATEHGFMYHNIRFSNAGTRWGSCSTSGTISLNIWLMQLPFDLIDYVIIHELCHTRQMNHSPAFWQLVEAILPDYKVRRSALKAMRPYL